MIQLEHIGIAVHNSSASEALFNSLLGISPYKQEYVETENVNTTFYKTGNAKIELLHSTDPDNVISRFIANKGEGIHHVAFLVDDIAAEMSRLREAGFHLLQEKAKMGADGKLVCFIHPKTTNGVLVELCQDIKSA